MTTKEKVRRLKVDLRESQKQTKNITKVSKTLKQRLQK